MRGITLLAPPAPMTRTQFARHIRYKGSAPWQPENNTERPNLRMNWIVVTGANGSHLLRMQWTAEENRRPICPVTLF